MVTHGYVTFRYKGVYYVFDNHSDSYCECLGKTVVDDVKDMINNHYIQYYKKKLLYIPLTNEMTDGDTTYYSMYDAIRGYNTSAYYTSNQEPYNSYVYIIDFDENEFITTKHDNRYTFNLFDIPDNWIEIVNETKNYMYGNKEAIKKEMIKQKISELEEQIKKLKLQLN
jgi:hypothetical protein